MILDLPLSDTSATSNASSTPSSVISAPSPILAFVGISTESKNVDRVFSCNGH